MGLARTPTSTGTSVKQLMNFATEDTRILLLENINATGRQALEKQGYQVEFHKGSLPEDELIEKIKFVKDSLHSRCTPDNNMLTSMTETST